MVNLDLEGMITTFFFITKECATTLLWSSLLSGMGFHRTIGSLLHSCRILDHLESIGYQLQREGGEGGKSKHLNIERTVVYTSLSREHIKEKRSVASFGFLNARSVRNKASEVNEFVTDNNIDILGVCETWLTQDDKAVISELTPVGYTFTHLPRSSKRGGGVGLLFRNTLNVRHSPSSVKFKSFELLQASIASDNTTTHIVVIYRPPGSSCPFSTFLDEFAALMDQYLLQPGSLIISGDFNIHVNEATTQSSLFKDLLQSYDLRQHVSGSTHIRGHTLDLLITRDSDANAISKLKVIGGISDHSAIICNLPLTKPELGMKLVTYRNLKSIEVSKFADDLDQEGITTQCSSVDPDTAVQSFNSIVFKTLNKHAPVKSKVVRIRPDTRWYNEDIAHGKIIRKQMERLWRTSGLEIHRQMYVAQRQTVQSLIRSAKVTYYKGLVEGCSGDSKKLYRLANDLLNRKATSVLPDYNVAEELACKFSTFFKNKVSTICDDLSSFALRAPFTAITNSTNS